MTYKNEKMNNGYFFVLFVAFCVITWPLIHSFTFNKLYASVFFLGVVALKPFHDFFVQKFYRVKIIDSTLNLEFLDFTIWSVPISSIIQIGNYIKNFTSRSLIGGSYIQGIIIKTQYKLYKIPTNLEDQIDFIKDLQSKNSNIITMNKGYESNFLTGASNKINSEYHSSREKKRTIIVFTLILIFLIVFFIYVDNLH